MANTGSYNAVETALRNSTADTLSGSNGRNLASPSRNVSNISAISLEASSETQHKRYMCPT
eukprot:2977820-Pleurochrysis_carterae.AAC.3